MLRKLYEDEEPEWVGISFDLPGATFRHQEYTEYKATAGKMDDDLAVQLPYVRRVCEVFGLPIARRARLRGRRRDRHPGPRRRSSGGLKVVVVSGDKDLLQLVSDDVLVLNPGREGAGSVMYDRKTVEEKFGVPPERVVDVLALVGDAVDNVPGVPGIGEKGARDLVREFGPVEEVLANADKVKRNAYREGLMQPRRRRHPLQAARHPARGRAGDARPGGAAAAAAGPRRRQRALHRARVRGPGQGVRAGGGAEPHARTRVLIEPDAEIERRRGGGAGGGAGRGLLRARRARAHARAAARGRPWPGRRGHAVYVPLAPLAAGGPGRRCPRRSCWSCCGRCSRTRWSASSPRAASTTGSCSASRGSAARALAFDALVASYLLNPGKRQLHAGGPRGRVPGRAAAQPSSRAHRGRRAGQPLRRPRRPPPRTPTSRCAWRSR